MIPLYDAHNHLQDERLAPHLDAILSNLPVLGVKRCVVNGTCESDWPAVEALAKRFSWIVPAFGLHPWFVKDRSANWFDTLRHFLDRNPRATVGEVGLDRWMRDPDIADQEKVFIAQLDLGAERNKAVSIHCLKAWGHLKEILDSHESPARGFLIHSYGGSAEMIPTFTECGAHFSISGYFAHDKKSGQRDILKKIHLDRLLVETDAPDMLPPPTLIQHPLENANDPRNLASIYEFAAGLFSKPLPEFAEQMENNFQKLFS